MHPGASISRGTHLRGVGFLDGVLPFLHGASYDDDGGVSGLDHRWTGRPPRHDAASTSRGWDDRPIGGGERFPRLRGAASGARSKGFAHHLRRHGRGCSRAVARRVPIRLQSARASRVPGGSRANTRGLSRYRLTKKRSSRARAQFENFIPFILGLATFVTRLVAKHRRVIDARRVHRPKTSLHLAHSSHHRPSMAASCSPRDAVDGDSSAASTQRRQPPPAIEHERRCVSASCSTPRSTLLEPSRAPSSSSSPPPAHHGERRARAGRPPCRSFAASVSRDRRRLGSRPASRSSTAASISRIRHRRTASAAWSAIVPSRANWWLKTVDVSLASPRRAGVPNAVCDESAGEAVTSPWSPKPCHLCRHVDHVLMISAKKAAGPLSKASAEFGEDGRRAAVEGPSVSPCGTEGRPSTLPPPPPPPPN